MTLQRVADDEASGLVEIGRPWLIVQRVTGMIEHWPHLDYLDRVQRMTPWHADRMYPALLATIALVVSLATAAWTTYRARIALSAVR